MSSIRHLVLRYLTDRPNEIVFKDDVMRELELAASQVTASVLGIQRESPIGTEVHTVLPGKAWRYVPVRPTVSGRRVTVTKGDTRRPLTQLIRDYLRERPHATIYVHELVDYTGRNEKQVQVGINNMKRGHPDMGAYVTTIIHGQSWRYEPPSETPAQPSTARARPTVTTVKPPTPTTLTVDVEDDVEPTDDVIVSNESGGLILEEVGRTKTAIIVSDADGNMYRATPLH